MTELSGRAAVVTGGGSGIGRALARALAAEGASVVVADIIAENAESVAGEIGSAGGSAVPAVRDVSDRASVRELKARANAAFGTISLLIANAGVTSVERLTELSDDELDWVTEVNLLGVIHCIRAFLPDMVEQRAGHVVATASIVGLAPVHLPYHVPYTMAKAGVIGMMLNLRTELSEVGVGCTVLCPSGVATRISQTSRYRPARFGGPFEGSTVKALGDFDRREKIVFRPPEEVAEMVLEAVRENRPMVVTDPRDRERFTREYVDLVLAAFDRVAEFDQRRQATPD
jgi:NAD(P)-dependent dehydrogenase (short-subunit alcohol dehydrogenase family)